MSKWKFQCARKGHLPNGDFPPETVSFNGNAYAGFICSDCGCAYFELIGKVSPILGPEGLIQG